MDRETKRFLAGFVDGDGCIDMPRPRKKNQTPTPTVVVVQSRNEGKPPELLHIAALCEGTIVKSGAIHPNRRTHWVYRASASTGGKRLLGIVCKYGVVKRKQAKLALKYLEGGKRDPERVHRRISRTKKRIHRGKILLQRLGPAYLSGLFCAEGSVAVYAGKLRAVLCQRSWPALCEAIAKKLGLGNHNGGQYVAYCSEALRFLQMIRPFAVGQKVEQIDLAIEYQALPRGHERKAEIAQMMKKLKKQ